MKYSRNAILHVSNQVFQVLTQLQAIISSNDHNSRSSLLALLVTVLLLLYQIIRPPFPSIIHVIKSNPTQPIMRSMPGMRQSQPFLVNRLIPQARTGHIKGWVWLISWSFLLYKRVTFTRNKPYSYYLLVYKIARTKYHYTGVLHIGDPYNLQTPTRELYWKDEDNQRFKIL